MDVMKMKNSKINEMMICGVSRKHSVPGLTAALLLSACCVFAQDGKGKKAAVPENAPDAAEQKIEYRNKETVRLQGIEKKIDGMVAQAGKFYRSNEFDKAIDLYLDARKQLADLYELHKQPRFQEKLDLCTEAVSKAYYYWAQQIYNDAVNSANLADFDKAIEKCQKAMEIYPPSKEKMEKIIARYQLMKDGVQVRKDLEEANPDPAEIREKNVLLRQGQVLYDTKQWDKARTKFEEVIALDPYNTTAIDYIRRINLRSMEAARQRTGVTRNARNTQATWELVTPLIKQEPSDSQLPENFISKNSQNEKIADKLKEIIIDKISFEEVSIATAIRYLRQCSKEKDPEKIGVNFVLRGKINQPLNRDGESVEDEGSNAGNNSGNNNNNNKDVEDAGDIEPLTMMLENIPLETVIKYICRQANLKYRIDDNAVVIASKDVPLDDVQTKVYPVEKSAITLRDGQTVQEFLTEKGITFDAGASAVYKEYIGRLIVTNTPKELQQVETLLSEMNKVDPQVLIQTKFVEIKLNDLEELGFKYQLSRNNSNVGYFSATSDRLTALAPGESFTSKDVSNIYTSTSDANWLQYNSTVNGNTTYTNNTGSTIYYTKAPLQKSSSSYTVGGGDIIRTISSAKTLESNTQDGLATDFSVYNNNGYRFNAQLYALDQADSADTLSCPRVTTMHDTPATIQLVTEKYFPTDWDESEYTIMGNNVPVFTGSVPDLDEEQQLGISLDVTPIVDSDNYTIHVLMRPLLRKFTGWDDYSYNVPVKLNDNSPAVNIPNTMIMPRIEERTVDTQATCSDNGTIVLGGMIRDEVTVVDDQYPVLGDLPLVGRFFQSKGRTSAKYNLLIFLSCRLVNPDGSPLRERESRGLPPFKY